MKFTLESKESLFGDCIVDVDGHSYTCYKLDDGDANSWFLTRPLEFQTRGEEVKCYGLLICSSGIYEIGEYLGKYVDKIDYTNFKKLDGDKDDFLKVVEKVRIRDRGNNLRMSNELWLNLK